MSGHRSFKQLTSRFSPDRRARVDARKAELRKAMQPAATRKEPAEEGATEGREPLSALAGNQVEKGLTGPRP